DTLGALPTANEVRAFLAECVQQRSQGVSESWSNARSTTSSPLHHSATPAAPSLARDRLSDALLARPEFVDYWTYKWSDLLLVQSRKLKAPAMWSYYNWIRNNVSANTPWDVFVRKILTAQGSTLENGAANFYVLH